jgi:hypothetical protein
MRGCLKAIFAFLGACFNRLGAARGQHAANTIACSQPCELLRFRIMIAVIPKLPRKHLLCIPASASIASARSTQENFGQLDQAKLRVAKRSLILQGKDRTCDRRLPTTSAIARS